MRFLSIIWFIFVKAMLTDRQMDRQTDLDPTIVPHLKLIVHKLSYK